MDTLGSSGAFINSEVKPDFSEDETSQMDYSAKAIPRGQRGLYYLMKTEKDGRKDKTDGADDWSLPSYWPHPTPSSLLQIGSERNLDSVCLRDHDGSTGAAICCIEEVAA